VCPRSGRPILVGLPDYPPNTFVATTGRAREPSAVPGVSGGERRGTRHPYTREKGAIVDEFTQELELMEAEERIDEERWEGIRRHVFPLLDAEARRLDADYRRLRYGG
jgi:hypothetical protein